MKYVIKGDPIPLARARHGKHGVWDSQKSEKLIAGISLRNQHGNKPLLTGPLRMNVVFYLPLSKTMAKKLKMPYSYHYFKPDISNMLKFIEDIATGIIYKDDCLIAKVTMKKVYDSEPRTEFSVKEL
jgi:Holliday junction resolvase RusA-like endonuclease